MTVVELFFPEKEAGDGAVILRWLKTRGDRVEAHEPIVELETDKATIEVAAPASGVIAEIVYAAGARVAAGMVLARIEAANAPHISPAVARLLREHSVSAEQIVGTGKEGRVRAEDVLAFVEKKASSSEPSEPTMPIPSRRVPHTSTRRIVASHMVESALHTAPHVTTVIEVDLARVLAHREAHRESLLATGVRLTPTAYFAAAVVRAVAQVPEVNSRWHPDALEIFSDVNLGIATAVDRGLIVPVIQRAQAFDAVFSLARAIQDLSSRARAGTLEPAEVKRGTLTLTNHGMSGGLLATPIIHQPQSAIVGVGKIEKRAVVIDDAVVIRPMAYVTLTIDHRALDGFQANSYLSALAQILREWG